MAVLTSCLQCEYVGKGFCLVLLH